MRLYTLRVRKVSNYYAKVRLKMCSRNGRLREPKPWGTSRQYNGRIGKVDQYQVGTFVSYAHNGIWTWIDGERFIPEQWFSEAYEQQRQQTGMAEEQTFKTKIQLGWTMFERAVAQGIPFAGVVFDSLYGRSEWLLNQCRAAHIEFYADVPESILVYRSAPTLNALGAVVGQASVTVKSLLQAANTAWHKVTIRPANCNLG
jgi:hypothetical protein